MKDLKLPSYVHKAAVGLHKVVEDRWSEAEYSQILAQDGKDLQLYDLRESVEIPFLYDPLRTTRNRQFCITKRRYMGWAPPAAKPRDRICILFGRQVPYVVRSRGKEYMFMGEAYIHGIINGKALKMKDIDLETIFLC